MTSTLMYLGLALLIALPALGLPPWPFAHPRAAAGTAAAVRVANARRHTTTGNPVL